MTVCHAVLDSMVYNGVTQHGGTMNIERKETWGITLYRDDPLAEEAAVDTVFLGTDDNLARAITTARMSAVQRSVRDPRWTHWTATVDTVVMVTWESEYRGVYLTSYEDARHGQRYYLGPTWQEGPEPW